MLGTEIQPGRDVCGHGELFYSKLYEQDKAFFSKRDTTKAAHNTAFLYNKFLLN